MQYGLCYLSVVALRSEASDSSELVSQVLYGDYFKVWNTENHGVESDWDLISMKAGSITSSFNSSKNSTTKTFTNRILQWQWIWLILYTNQEQQLHPILLGSTLNGLSYLNHTFEG